MITVIWYDQAFGNWDHGLIDSIFTKHPESFVYHNSKELIYPDKAIIIVTGKPAIEPLRKYLDSIKSGLVILTSDEDAYFDWQNAIPKHLQLWTQYYSPSKSGISNRILLGAPKRIKDYKINTHLEKKYLWSFVGQSQNPFRQRCVEVLQGTPDGFLHIVPQFGGGDGGVEYQEYLDIMCQSKYVICPAGSMCVDSFRVYEAMECGAIPITDMRAPRDKEDFNYWTEVYPKNNFIQVANWDNGFLTEVFKNGWPFNNDWWTVYKIELENKLLSLCS